MGRIKQIRREDGTLVPFRERKIVESTLMALKAAGQDDVRLAEDLSGAVILFLEKTYAHQPPSIEDVETMLLKVLRETGHPEAALHYESLQRRRRELEAELQVVSSLRAMGEDVHPEEVPTATPWDRERLVSDLESSGRVPAGLAEEVGGAVEALLIRSGLRTVSTRLLAELRDSELRRRQFDPLEPAGERIEVRRAEIEACLERSATASRPVEALVGGRVLEAWALDAVHERTTVTAHERGLVHLHGLEDPFRVERLVLPMSIAVAEGTIAQGAPAEAWLIELGRTLARVRPHVREEIVLPDLVTTIDTHVAASDAPRFARTLLSSLEFTDAFGRAAGPSLRLVLPLGWDASASPARIALIEALVDALAETGGVLGVCVDLVHVPERDPGTNDLVRRALELAGAWAGARLRFPRDGDPEFAPSDVHPHPLAIGVGRMALNLPLALTDTTTGGLTEALQDLEVVAEHARSAFLETYWSLRRTSEAGLQALVMALGGPERVAIPAQGQEVDLEVWGLHHALELLVARGVISSAARPEAAARILGFLDYFLQTDTDGVSFRVRLGGPSDRTVRARFLRALDAWAERNDHPEVRATLEGAARERRHELTLPVVLPLLEGGNDTLLQASFASRVGPGLALPWAVCAHGEGEYLLDQIAAETKLGSLSLEPLSEGDGIFEQQGELFG